MSSNPAAALPAPMPPELRERGWKMSRADGKYRAKNDKLSLYSSACDSPDEAIAAARELDAGKTMSIAPGGEVAFREPSPTRDSTFTIEVTETKNIGWGIIRIDGGTQPREGIDQETVNEYAERMLEGVKFPPLVVFFDGKFYWLADGFHRYFAHKKHVTKLGPGIDVEVHQGTKRDAILYSLGANATHGLPRSPADKRAAVLKMLEDEEWSQWSDGVIAEKANVSQPFVSKLRRELESEQSTQNVLSDNTSAPPRPPAPRRGKDNRVISTLKIGKASKKISPAQTDIARSASLSAVAKSGNGAAEPEGWRDQPLVINIAVKPGKSDKRGLTVSGRAGQGKPIFRGDFTLLDLQPMPPALSFLIGDLQKAYTRSRAGSPNTVKKSKSKPKASKRPARKK